jgi:hypothetical protein
MNAEATPSPPATAPDSGTVLDRSVGENLDRLITIDMRGDEIGRVVYAAARALTTEPLSLAGARFLKASAPPGGAVLFLTGFAIPPSGHPETDGLIGSAVLALALSRCYQSVPVFVCEPALIGALRACVTATGMLAFDSVATARACPNAVAFLPFDAAPADGRRAAEDLATLIGPSACVAIERPGRNAKGQYHFAGGQNVSEAIGPIDDLFEEAGRRHVPTLAIGDFGNELGMGAIAETVKRETPAGGNCGCGCGGGTACEIAADMTVACTVSDWGAYAVAAAISYLEKAPGALLPGGTYRRILDAAAAAGALDGTSRMAIPHIDGVADDYNARLVEQLRSAVAYPSRPQFDNAMRAFRATRLSEPTS